MIVYADSSVLARAYLRDEDGHAEAASLLADPERPVVTGSWSKIEVSGAIVRAARTSNRPLTVDEAGLLAAWDNDTSANGNVTVLAVEQGAVEAKAMSLVRQHGLRALDAWHLAVAILATPDLTDPGEPVAFASRDDQQSAVAAVLGLEVI